MARCVARFALLFLIDLVRPATQFKAVVDGASIVMGKGCGLSRNALDELLKLTNNRPEARTLEKLYAALNAAFKNAEMPALLSGALVDELIEFDQRLLAGPTDDGVYTRTGALTLAARDHVKWLNGIAKGAGSTAVKTDAADRLWSHLMQARADYAAIDLLLPDRDTEDLVSTDERFRRLESHSYAPWPRPQSSADRGQSVTSIVDPALLALSDLEDLEHSCEWNNLADSGPLDRQVFGSLRLHLRVLSAVRFGQLTPHQDRYGNPYWDEVCGATVRKPSGRERRSDLMSEIRLAQPVAITTRLLRNVLEISSYRERPDDVLRCWQHIKDIDRKFRPSGSDRAAVDRALSYMPKTNWEGVQPISQDQQLCCARRVIRAYEAELEKYGSNEFHQFRVQREFASRKELLSPCSVLGVDCSLSRKSCPARN